MQLLELQTHVSLGQVASYSVMPCVVLMARKGGTKILVKGGVRVFCVLHGILIQ